MTLRSSTLKAMQAAMAERRIPQLFLYRERPAAGGPFEMRDSDRPYVSTSARSYELMRPYFSECMDVHEEFWIMMLDRGNKVIGTVKASQGGMHGTVADPKIIMGCALLAGASGLILFHNHPSGQLRPSMEDISLTKRLVEGARFMDIMIQDHIIMGREGYYSFADNGQL